MISTAQNIKEKKAKAMEATIMSIKEMIKEKKNAISENQIQSNNNLLKKDTAIEAETYREAILKRYTPVSEDEFYDVPPIHFELQNYAFTKADFLKNIRLTENWSVQPIDLAKIWIDYIDPSIDLTTAYQRVGRALTSIGFCSRTVAYKNDKGLKTTSKRYAIDLDYLKSMLPPKSLKAIRMEAAEETEKEKQILKDPLDIFLPQQNANVDLKTELNKISGKSVDEMTIAEILEIYPSSVIILKE